MPRQTPAVRAGAATAVFLVMLAASWSRLPAELDPGHLHVVIGGSDEERARALAAHLAGRHGDPATATRVAPRAHLGHRRHVGGSCHGEADDPARVLSIHVGGGLGITAFGTGDPPAVTFTPVIPAPAAAGRALLLPHAPAPDPPPRLPDPPPRAS